jgi:paraquat-inducible protein B
MAERFDDLPTAVREPKRRWSPQLVWLIPIVAVVIGGWLAVKSVLERGPTITITFKTAEGLEEGKTAIKYKNVEMGHVKSILFNDDHSLVLVKAEFTKQAEKFLVDDTRFWVVRPRISAGEISGLGTLFSGAFIGMDIGTSKAKRGVYTGLEVPPVISADVPGRYYTLHSKDLGSLDVGSPIYYRRLQVGQIVAYELDKQGNGLTFKAFVQAPYDKFVRVGTRFWHASGIDVTVDASGVKVDTQSIVSILSGGIAFADPPFAEGTVVAAENTVFELVASHAQAMKMPDLKSRTVVIVFRESVRGLSIGAPVDFRGIVIGEVTAIDVNFDVTNNLPTMPVTVRIYPDRLTSRYQHSVENTEATNPATRFKWAVEHGMRAQLRSGNLLTGELYIAADLFPDAPKVKIDWSADPVEIPSVGSSIQQLQATLGTLAKKLEHLPLDAIGNDLRQTLQSMTKTLKTADKTLETADQFMMQINTDITPEARATLVKARETLTSVEQTFGSDAPMQTDVRHALSELARAAQSLRVLADYLERHPEALIQGKAKD